MTQRVGHLLFLLQQACIMTICIYIFREKEKLSKSTGEACGTIMIVLSLVELAYHMISANTYNAIWIAPLCVRTMRTVLLGILVLCFSNEAIKYDTIHGFLWFNVIWTPIITTYMMVYVIIAMTANEASWSRLQPNAYLDVLLSC
jgi:hypothetical protein